MGTMVRCPQTFGLVVCMKATVKRSTLNAQNRIGGSTITVQKSKSRIFFHWKHSIVFAVLMSPLFFPAAAEMLERGPPLWSAVYPPAGSSLQHAHQLQLLSHQQLVRQQELYMIQQQAAQVMELQRNAQFVVGNKSLLLNLPAICMGWDVQCQGDANSYLAFVCYLSDLTSILAIFCLYRRD